MAVIDSTLRRYGDSASFFSIFHRNNMNRYASYPEWCCCNPAPSLGVASKVYGKQSVTIWLLGYVEDLIQYAGIQSKATADQEMDFAKTIRIGQNDLKVTEIMLFFFLLKKGDLGWNCYGYFDPIYIGSKFGKFREYRSVILCRVRDMETERRIQRERSNPSVVTREAYNKKHNLPKNYTPFRHGMEDDKKNSGCATAGRVPEI